MAENLAFTSQSYKLQMNSVFLTATWKNLIMANYIVDPAVLTRYLPYKTELDQFNGNVHVSLVGFMFCDTRILGASIPFHVNFEEVNLRFYVRYNDNGIWKRGTVFIKEIVPKPAITLIANTLYREKYCTMPMKHFLKESGDQIELGYHWKYRNKWNRIEAVTHNIALPMLESSEVHFIAEHYWGYSKYNSKKTFEYAVQHVPWKVFPVMSYLVDCDFESLYGPHFSALAQAVPQSVFVAQGSPVAVLHKRNIV